MAISGGPMIMCECQTETFVATGISETCAGCGNQLEATTRHHTSAAERGATLAGQSLVSRFTAAPARRR